MIGLVILIISLPIYFFAIELATLLSIIGIIFFIITKHNVFIRNIKMKDAKVTYDTMKYSNPVSSETLKLSKIIDITPNKSSHKLWLRDAVEAIEKEYRISGKKMFLYNRNRSSAVYPYLNINLENKKYKKKENYEKLFYKSGNYTDICKFYNLPINKSLELELEKFCLLIEKKEQKIKKQNLV